ncbi:MAG: hypothetical protein LH614_00185 [Pyrinomonadaceae bacterium]|nr:hypothetical protein [Pyrinomonadaceae bacterium]
MSEEATQPTEIKGGAIIQGSLFWENEHNCIPGDEEKGKARRVWRENHLSLNLASPIPFPIRYGRCSSSRLCTYTMVMSKDCLSEDKLGQAKVVPFQKIYQSSNLTEITSEIEALTKVEGISPSGRYFATGSIAIAIWINPDSRFTADIEKYWNNLIQTHGYQNINSNSFNWSDGTFLTQNFQIDITIADVKLDFLLLTYMQPKHRILSLNHQQKYPNSQEIAEEIKKTGYSTYFCQNIVSGITTSDDEEIFKYIKN